MKIHHIGYIVTNIDKAEKQFHGLGFSSISQLFHDELRGIYIRFFEKDGYTVEVISPSRKDSVVSNLIKQHRNMPYHICYESFNFSNDIETLKHNGYIEITKKEPAIAFDNKDVIFLIHPHLGMIEVIDTEDNNS